VRVVYFTAGSVGAGHVVRGLAIARALSRAGFRGEFRTLGPRHAYPALAPHEEVEIRSAELLDEKLAPRSELAEKLERLAPDLLIVDLFWAPLRWILPQRRWNSWLLLRRCPPEWFVGPKKQHAPFDPSLFSRAFAIEPGLDAPISLEEISPIVICNHDECRPRGALRNYLHVPPDQSLVVVAHAGKPDEMARFPVNSAHRFDLFAESALFPLAEWLDDADEIHCGAGYNSFWETIWLGRAARTHFVPFARTIDDQAWRIARGSSHVMKENGADRLARQIVAG
jgi:hypothetical protein